MRHASLFSGIGGFDLAAEWMGWTNVFNCEWEDFPRKVLKHHFPNAIQYGDIRELDATKYRGRIDILTGGFPCQPYSTAGKRLGKEDERHLWPEMLRIIREVQPLYVVGENVLGITSWNGGMVFDEVQADLEAEGYEVLPFVLPACAVNAPHRRDRVWFIAYRENIGFAQTTNIGRKWGEHKPNNWDKVRHSLNADGGVWYATNAERNGLEYGTEPGSMGGGKGEARECATGYVEAESKERDVTNTMRPGGRQNHRQGNAEQRHKNGTPSNWENFPTQSPICGGNDGLPSELDGITFSKWRNESIKAYGNAIVPQVALQIFKAIQETDRHD